MKQFVIKGILSFTIYWSQSLSAQTIRMEYLNYYDTIKPDVKKGTIVLHSDKGSVSYNFLDKSEKLGEKKLPPKQGLESHQVIVMAIDTSRIDIYKNFAAEITAFKSGTGLGFKADELYYDSLHNFEWKLRKDTKKINNYACYKATGFWRGRNYTAWYAPSIPISNGPRKIGGLPGLILEVYDEELFIYWRLNSLINIETVLPVFPTDFKGSFADYKEKFRNNFKRIKQSIEANNNVDDPSCTTCKSSANITIKTREKLMGDY
jgi:GLPGLI family protein